MRLAMTRDLRQCGWHAMQPHRGLIEDNTLQTTAPHVQFQTSAQATWIGRALPQMERAVSPSKVLVAFRPTQPVAGLSWAEALRYKRYCVKV